LYHGQLPPASDACPICGNTDIRDCGPDYGPRCAACYQPVQVGTSRRVDMVDETTVALSSSTSARVPAVSVAVLGRETTDRDTRSAAASSIDKHLMT
jgi:hypothetical protein